MTAAERETYVITEVAAPTLPQRRRRYLLLMLLRVLVVPGVVVLPLPALVQAALVMLAAVSQMVAVVSANTPDHRPVPRPHTLVPQPSALPGAASSD